MAADDTNWIIQRTRAVFGGAADWEEGVESGFTLIELLVVLVIIAILLAIAIPAFFGTVATGDDRAAQSDLNTSLTSSKIIFFLQNSSYPVTANMVTALEQQQPELTYSSVSSPDASTIAVEQDHDAAGDTGVVLAAKAADGTCWYATDSAVPNVPSHGGVLSFGVWYGSAPSGGTDCTTNWNGVVTNWSTTWPGD